MNKLPLFILILIGQLAYAKPSTSDSLKTVVKRNYVYITHIVASGETLYSLVKKYNSSIPQVYQANPTLRNKPNLTNGQKVYFPYLDNKKKVAAFVTKKEVKKFEKQINEDNKTTEITKNEHIVKQGETVFSISQKYNLTPNELIALNHLEKNNIKLGQSLILRKSAAIKGLEPKPEAKSEVKAAEKKSDSEVENETPAVPAAPLVMPSGIKIAEEGIAEVINTKNRSAKSLALHRSAPIGSVISVTNEATGASVLAKVVGNIDSNGPDQDILVKLSPAAYRRLKPKDSKIRAKVVYFSKNFGLI